MLQRIFPQENSSLSSLTALSEEAGQATILLAEMLGSPLTRYPQLLQEAFSIESKAKELLLTTMSASRSSFATPIPREDIFTLATTLYSLVENLTSAAHSIQLNQLEDFPQEVSTLLDLIQHQASLTTAAIPRLRNLKDLDSYWITMLRTTKQAQRTAEEHQALALKKQKTRHYLASSLLISHLTQANQDLRTLATEIGRLSVQES